MWGNGKQTRSFCYIDDAVEGILRLMVSDYKKPLNIGSDEMVSMNQMAELVFKIGKKTLPIKCAPSPQPWTLGPAPWPPPRPRMLAAPRRRTLARSLARHAAAVPARSPGSARLTWSRPAARRHIPGPEGVRGRNSDNTLIKEVLGWAPTTTLEEGLNYTHTWITAQIAEFGGSMDTLTTSKICTQQMAEDGCDMTHAKEAQ